MGQKADALQAELDRFKAQVREEAISVARRQSWCDDGLNETLRRLGLPEKERPRPPVRVRVPMAVPVTIAVNVEGVANEAEAFERIRQNPQLALVTARRLYGSNAELRLPDSAAATAATAGTAGTAVPQVGAPCPAPGPWYEVSSQSGGPNQCREWSPDRTFYCTRAAGHDVSAESPHVAAGRSEGVHRVWVEGGTPRESFVSDTDDEDDDAEEAEPGAPRRRERVW